MHIRQQGHSIHIFDGIAKIKRASDNMVMMTGVEYGILLKLKGTPTRAHNFAYHAHQNEGILSFSLLWHARVGHINYDNLRLLKKNGVFGFPTIPRKLKQCDSYTLGKHSKQPFMILLPMHVKILD